MATSKDRSLPRSNSIVAESAPFSGRLARRLDLGARRQVRAERFIQDAP
jgi:hypothetical protein